MNDNATTPTSETPLQILQNGQGRFAGEIEQMLQKRCTEVSFAVRALVNEKAQLERQLAIVTEQRDRLAVALMLIRDKCKNSILAVQLINDALAAMKGATE